MSNWNEIQELIADLDEDRRLLELQGYVQLPEASASEPGKLDAKSRLHLAQMPAIDLASESSEDEEQRMIDMQGHVELPSKTGSDHDVDSEHPLHKSTSVSWIDRLNLTAIFVEFALRRKAKQALKASGLFLLGWMAFFGTAYLMIVLCLPGW